MAKEKRWGFSEHDQGHIDRKPRLIFGWYIKTLGDALLNWDVAHVCWTGGHASARFSSLTRHAVNCPQLFDSGRGDNGTSRLWSDKCPRGLSWRAGKEMQTSKTIIKKVRARDGQVSHTITGGCLRSRVTYISKKVPIL